MKKILMMLTLIGTSNIFSQSTSQPADGRYMGIDKTETPCEVQVTNVAEDKVIVTFSFVAGGNAISDQITLNSGGYTGLSFSPVHATVLRPLELPPKYLYDLNDSATATYLKIKKGFNSNYVKEGTDIKLNFNKQTGLPNFFNYRQRYQSGRIFNKETTFISHVCWLGSDVKTRQDIDSYLDDALKKYRAQNYEYCKVATENGTKYVPKCGSQWDQF